LDKESKMIIDTKGNELHAWYRTNGALIFDEDNKYGIKFAIGVEYSDEQRLLFSEIKALKKYLKDTDYRALKYADGAYTEEEYRPYKEARADARARINEIEKIFVEPTLTREEIDEAERLVMEKQKEVSDDNTDNES